MKVIKDNQIFNVNTYIEDNLIKFQFQNRPYIMFYDSGLCQCPFCKKQTKTTSHDLDILRDIDRE